MSRADNRLKVGTVNKYKKQQLKEFLKELGFSDLIPKLLKNHRFWYFMDRPYVYFDFFPEDLDIPLHSVKEVEKNFHKVFSDFTYTIHDTIHDTNKSISCSDGLGKYNSLAKTIEGFFTPESKVYKEFLPFLEQQRDEKNSEAMCYRLSESIAISLVHSSAIDGFVYGVSLDPRTGSDELDCSVLRYRYGVFRRKPKRKDITVRGKSRLCYELLMNEAIETLSVKNITYKGKEYPLYIQAHALKRAVERLSMPNDRDSYNILRLHTMYEDSFFYNNQILIPVVFDAETNEKVGYFLCSLTQKECVIMTFLFITQIDTPEGDMLCTRLSIDKEEQNYLHMANYDQVVRSDIRDDSYLRTIYEECNLGHLFELNEEFLGTISGSAAFIRKTLMLDEHIAV